MPVMFIILMVVVGRNGSPRLRTAVYHGALPCVGMAKLTECSLAGALERSLCTTEHSAEETSVNPKRRRFRRVEPREGGGGSREWLRRATPVVLRTAMDKDEARLSS